MAEEEKMPAAVEESSAWSMIASLLWCQLTTFCRAVFLSFSAGMRSFGKRNLKVKIDTEENERGEFTLYEGMVWHKRRHPVRHHFEYKVRFALVNLDKIPSWFENSDSSHHMSADEARAFVGTSGPVYLLCIPNSLGYEQQPISIYYCYEGDGKAPVKAIAEVTNTPWGERVKFEFQPAKDKVAKLLPVSPFIDMKGSWLMNASSPGEKMTVTIQVEHPEFGKFFLASLALKKVQGVDSPESFFWLMPHKVAVWIYWHALVLLWKGVGFIQHPKYVDGDAYRRRAQLRDEVQSKASFASSSCPVSNGAEQAGNLISLDEASSGSRRLCAWHDAAASQHSKMVESTRGFKLDHP
ncbi:hypothetical protein R1sor_022607 [Riccia sorocarpa]|uniref:DUF1365 domain-containing protein n=1 Tax=Riccia sorocarpa TaxID=122646 RepID=A0ABD3GM38_9MARC